MVLYYYVFLRILELVQNVGKNASACMPEDASVRFRGSSMIRNIT